MKEEVQKPPIDVMSILLLISWCLQLMSDALIPAMVLNLAALAMGIKCLLLGKSKVGLLGIALSIFTCPFFITIIFFMISGN